MRYPRKTLLMIAVGILSLCCESFADTVTIDTGTSFNLTYNSGNYDPYEPCLGITPGGTWLNPLEYLPRENDYTNDLLAALYGQYGVNTSNEDYTLIYQYSVADSSLTGTMLIDWYQAVDEHSGQHCYHGAEIVAYYDYGEGEEDLGLDWVQLYDEFGGSVVSPYDFTVDGSHDQSPAYYAPGYGPWTPSGYSLDPNHDMTWSDGPYDRHEETKPWMGGVEFYMFLASFGDMYPDPNSNSVFYQDVTIYDGIVWGYFGDCYIVPEPATVGLFCLGLLGLVRRQVLKAR